MDRVAVASLIACLLLCPALCGLAGSFERHEPLPCSGDEEPCGCICDGAIRSESASTPGADDEVDTGALVGLYGDAGHDLRHPVLSRASRTRSDARPYLSLGLWALLLRFLC
jgi:hypothetical protein